MTQDLSRKLNINEEVMEIFNLQGGIFNIVTISKIKNHLAENILREALDILQNQIPWLKCRIVNDGGQLYFTTEATEKIPLEVIVTSDKDLYLEKIKVELNTSLPSHQYLIKCLLLYENNEENYCYLITTIHHSISDGLSAVNLQETILKCCQHIKQNESIDLNDYPQKLISMPDVIPQYTSGVKAQIKALLYGLNICYKLWQKAPARLKHEQYVSLEQRSCGIIQRQLKLDSQTLIKLCRQKGITVHAAICTALLLSVDKKIRTDKNINSNLSIIVRTYVDLRRRIKPEISPRYLGFLVSAVTSVHSLYRDISFWDLARDVQEKVQTQLEKKEHFVSLPLFKKLALLYLKNYDSVPYAFAVTNVGKLQIENNYGEFALEEISFVPAKPRFGQIFTVAVTTFQDKMILNFVASIPTISKRTLESLANDVIECLMNTCEQEV